MGVTLRELTIFKAYIYIEGPEPLKLYYIRH